MGGWREERRLARSRGSVSCLPGWEEDQFLGPLPCPVDALSSLLEPPPVSLGPAEEGSGARGWGEAWAWEVSSPDLVADHIP